MPKLERVNQLIFANSSGSRETTAFGTAKNPEPTYTKDISTIMNSNYLQGWNSAVLPDKAPYMEDSNALYYMITRQLAYILRAGLPEWNAETTYYENDLVKAANSSNEVTVYKSLTNDNTGNDPSSDTTNWKVFQSERTGELATYEIGLPQPTFSNTLYTNEIWLEGQAVSRATYAELFNIYGTTYGVGDGSTTFNVPDCRNRVLWGSTSFGYISAGLPNITGYESMNYSNPAGGAFYKTGGLIASTDGSRAWNQRVNFDASRSNSIYGNSSTVQPPAIKCRVKTRWY